MVPLLCRITASCVAGLLKLCFVGNVDVRMILTCCGRCAIQTRTCSSCASALCLQHLSTTLLRSGCLRCAQLVSRCPSFSLARSRTFELTSKLVINRCLSFFQCCYHQTIFLFTLNIVKPYRCWLMTADCNNYWAIGWCIKKVESNDHG